MRLQFKFYKSYYDVMNELPEKNQLEFLKAILNKQFYGKDPTLTGIVKLAYVSQRHSIESSLKGYLDKTGDTLDTVTMLPPTQGGIKPPPLQLEIIINNNNSNNNYKSFAHLKLSFDEYDKLILLGYSQSQINNVLDSIENYKKNTNYKSLFLTAKKWLEKDSEGKKDGAIIHNMKQNQQLKEMLKNTPLNL